MKLTIAEQEFIHDAQVFLERGQPRILIDSKKYYLLDLSKACKEHLGTDVWFNVVKLPHDPVHYYLETDFSKRYISDVFTNKLEFITPQPFDIIHHSQLLKVSEYEQKADFERGVKFFKELKQPQPKPLTFWQKVKQFFA